MQRERQKPKIRLTRNADGTIGAPRDVSKSADDLFELWGKQTASLELPRLSIKEQFIQVKDAFNKKRARKQSAKSIVAQKSAAQTRVAVSGNKAAVRKGKSILPVAVTTVQAPAVTRPISITVSIPAVRIPRRIIPTTRKSIILVIACLIVMSGGLFMILRHGSSSNVSTGEVQGAVTESIPTNITPDFPVMTPLGKGVAELGGFAKVSPSGSPAVYAYKDTIGSTVIRVSQQQLPDSLRTDQAGKLKELAEGFNANTPLEIGDNTAYIGASVNGAQSVVYSKGENLVLIASEATIPNSDWVTYIGNLRY